MFVDVLLPIAVPKPYTYQVPKELEESIVFGIRVEVPLKNHVVSGIIVKLGTQPNVGSKIKNIVSILDKSPTINLEQYQLWQWIAEYYCCTLGEVMNNALPGGLKLVSETKVIAQDQFDPYSMELSDDEFMVAEALKLQGELRISDIQDITQRKSIVPIIQSLIEKEAILIKAELIEKYKPKKESFIQFTEEYRGNNDKMAELFEQVQRSEYQKQVLLAYIQMSQGKNEVLQKSITQRTGVSSGVINAMVKKGIFIKFKKEVSRISHKEIGSDALPLTPLQINKLAEIKAHQQHYTTTLLHGVTGSGKTRIYIELAQEMLEQNKQVLYLLPEIALTTHIVERLRVVFGDKVLVYHSRLNSHQRVELYREAHKGKSIIIGPRSAIFMPFNNLGLIIIDEEHDPSFKQQSPNPRYNARDTAMVLANLHDAKVLLGTATPSIESWVNVEKEKYGKVELKERFGDAQMPKMELIDLKYAYKTGQMKSFFSFALIEQIKQTVAEGDQVILFQNRRGFAPLVQCEPCGWIASCRNCDTSLTLHKYFEELRCHYCGYRQKLPKCCPDCGNEELDISGFGTEKIQLKLQEILPEMKIERFDHDTVGTKNKLEKIIHQFSNKEIDILIGTQMISKGLDFENVNLVGIINADKMLSFPDFRAHERAFQLIMQVSGRAGRRRKQGKVLIQTYSTDKDIYQQLLNNKWDEFVKHELHERKNHLFPPFIKLINIEIRHKKIEIVKEGAQILGEMLSKKLGNRVSTVFEPSISRIRGYYIRMIVIKMELNKDSIENIKKWVQHFRVQLKNSDGFKSLRISIDVDPY